MGSRTVLETAERRARLAAFISVVTLLCIFFSVVVCLPVLHTHSLKVQALVDIESKRCRAETRVAWQFALSAAVQTLRDKRQVQFKPIPRRIDPPATLSQGFPRANATIRWLRSLERLVPAARRGRISLKAMKLLALDGKRLSDESVFLPEPLLNSQPIAPPGDGGIRPPSSSGEILPPGSQRQEFHRDHDMFERILPPGQRIPARTQKPTPPPLTTTPSLPTDTSTQAKPLPRPLLGPARALADRGEDEHVHHLAAHGTHLLGGVEAPSFGLKTPDASLFKDASLRPTPPGIRVQFGQKVCPQCRHGPPGPPGEPGDGGRDGRDGEEGTAGKDGVVITIPALGPTPALVVQPCPQGEQGLPGPMGPDGPPGPQGLEGIRGFKGYPSVRPGRRGPLGPPGPTGDAGPRGRPGPPGRIVEATITIPGPAGETGPTGVKGPRGKSGIPVGPPGPQGDVGEPGLAGKDGKEGDEGLEGPQGEGGNCDHCPEPRYNPGYGK